MKHHIAVKFIAVILCAAALLGVVAGGFGVALLSSLDLYNKSAEQVYNELTISRGAWFSQDVVVCYASQALGGCPEALVEQHYDFSRIFNAPYYSYVIKDAEGSVVASSNSAGNQSQSGVEEYVFPVTGKYMHLVSSVTDAEKNAPPIIPCQGMQLSSGLIQLSAVGETARLMVALTPADTTDQLLFLSHDESVVTVDSSGVVTAVAPGETSLLVICGGAQMECPVICTVVPETTAPIAVAALLETESPVQEDDGWDETWDGEEETWDDEEETWDDEEDGNDEEDWDGEEETLPETEAPTEPETEPVTEPVTEPATEPAVPQTTAVSLPESDVPVTEPVLVNGRVLTDYVVYNEWYYDHTLQDGVSIEYVLLDLPAYTVELRLQSGAMDEDQYLPLLSALRNYRNQVLPLLAASLLLFAALGVYLCCAAGRSPKSQEVRAGGLNRLPLELYGGATLLALFLIVGFSVEAVRFGHIPDLKMLCLLIAAGAYGGCLLVVGFLFALAAQVKTPGRFWLRNSLCGHCWRIVVWLWRRFARLFPFFGRWLGALWQWCRKVICFVCSRFARLFTMLPLVWQWLIIGLAMLLVLLIALVGRYELLIFLAVVGDALIVIYGAYAFGKLLDGTKRMCKGDLETRIDDRHLVGGFRIFSANLNALADVANEAARKQLKSERMKTELITNVSHDIKTPLTSIINYVDLLQKPHSPQEQAQYLEVLSRQSQQLKKLIEDLMDMSKASTGNMTVDITVVDAVESVNQALGEFSDKLGKAQLTPVFRHSEDAVPVLADGRITWRVLSNLLSNAVKYALPGTRLYIDLMQLDGKVLLSMKNVSRDELNIDADELMERFVRGDCSRNTEGSGLGLNIAKSMMELQKGQLELLVDGDLFKVTLIFPGADIQ